MAKAKSSKEVRPKRKKVVVKVYRKPILMPFGVYFSCDYHDYDDDDYICNPYPPTFYHRV